MKKVLFFIAVLLTTIPVSAKNVSVTINPADKATVFLKGNVYNPVSPGVYSITVSIVDLVFTVKADGYDSEQFVINLKSPSTMQINLKPNRKTVTITTDPAEASIFVDGKERGRGFVTFDINKGETKQIKTMADGFDNFFKQVSFNDQPDISMSYNIPMTQNRKEINILIDVPSAEFYADGTLIAKGKNTATVTLYKNRPTQLIVRAEGFLEYSRILNYTENVASLNLTQELSVDQAYAASEPGVDIANKRMEFMVKKTMSRDDAIQRMKYYISELFETLEINDNVSGWYRTAWNIEEIQDKIIRTRVELKEIPDNGDGQLKYKFLLQSQCALKKDAKDEDYHNWDRVLKKYVKLVTDVRNLVE